MKTNKLVLMKLFPLDFQAQADRFLKSLLQFAEAPSLGVAALQIRDDAYVEAVLVLFDDDGKLITLHW